MWDQSLLFLKVKYRFESPVTLIAFFYEHLVRPSIISPIQPCRYHGYYTDPIHPARASLRVQAAIIICQLVLNSWYLSARR